MVVPEEYSQKRKDQLTAFSDTNTTLVKKLKDIGTKIQEKQKMHAEMAIQNAQASIVSISESEKAAGQDQYMTHGVTLEQT